MNHQPGRIHAPPLQSAAPPPPPAHPCRSARATMVTAALTLAASVVLAGSGCASGRSSPYDPMSESARDSLAAQRLTQEAAKIMQSNPAKAEKLLREALGKDLYHGPAHNNLGVMYLKQGELYQAASEFEWARKLMPGAADPRLNLGLTLERAGRIDEAIQAYRTALEVYPGHIATFQAIACAQLRHRCADDSTKDLLREIALRGESGQWRQWAQKELLQTKP